jgi:alginate O-acetyltransferase complex protein AlgI
MKDMNTARTMAVDLNRQGRGTREWVGWVPLAVLPAIAFAFCRELPAWVFMWAMAFALYYGCKWLTWWQNRNIKTNLARHLGYLLLWPGMDAKAFLQSADKTLTPRSKEWMVATATALFGAAVVWVISRRVPVTQEILRGWVGWIGLGLMLNFGTFRLLSLAWRAAGVNAEPLMRAPVLATSLGEFWGMRWNSAFNRLVHGLVFRPLHRKVGIAAATMLAFFASGVVHDLVISVPARGGYSLPTLYFLIQGGGLLLERSGVGRTLGLRRGATGWLFTMAVTAGPAFWLFHPAFVMRVILPFLHALKAT